MIATSSEELIIGSIGNTPVLRANRMVHQLPGDIYFKCEFLNPSGSHKDRMYLYGIKKLEDEGKIKKGMTLIDFSSGNAGAALSLIGSILGYNVVIVRPSGFSYGKAMQILAYGGKIVETPVEEGIDGCRKKALQIVNELGSDAFMMFQTEREFNIESFTSLAYELVSFIQNNNIKLDAFVCPVGTGGTITAVARTLHREGLKTKIIAVDIEEAPGLYNTFYHTNLSMNFHNVEGMSVGEVFKNTDISVIDEVLLCSYTNAWEESRILASREKMFVGPSSGSGYFIAKKIAQKLPKGFNIMTILWDQGLKYVNK